MIVYEEVECLCFFFSVNENVVFVFLIGVQLFVQVYGEVFDCFGFVFGGIELSFFRYGYDFVQVYF